MKENKNIDYNLLPLSITLMLSQQEDIPYLMIRRKLTLTDKNIDTIKTLLSCAFSDQPVIVYPKFLDKFSAIGTLCEKGILYRDNKTGKYIYTI